MSDVFKTQHSGQAIGWLSRMNPFARLERPREAFAWSMYDLANQSFQLLIKTLLFGLYVQQVVTATPAGGELLWTAMSASSMLCIAISSPILGAIADRRAWRREMLLASGLISGTFTAMLAFIGPGDVLTCFAFYLLAAVACGLGENFLGAFLPEISTPKNIGYVSAIGFLMSYVGALMLLFITWIYSVAWGGTNAANFWPMFVFAGAWFIAGILPAFLWLHERTPPTIGPAKSVIQVVLYQLIESIQEVRGYRQLVRFFVAYFIYSLGTMAILSFLGIIAKDVGFALHEMLLLSLAIAISAGVSAACTARFQDQVGHKRTIMAFLAFWIVAMLGIAGTQYFRAPFWTFWIISIVIGLALGGAGTASRAMVGALTPAHRSAEFFGLWGMVNQVSGILGVVTFGLLKSFNGQVVAVLALAGFFSGGLLLLLRVDLEQGLTLARSAEAQEGIEDAHKSL